MEPGGKTELETAQTPQSRRPGPRGVLGLSIPVKPGITPGSGPGHLGLFGYDPLKYVIGRGALEATGIGFELGPMTWPSAAISARSTPAGNISDRRAGPHRQRGKRAAGRASSAQVKIPGVEIFVEPVKEHRFVVVFRGAGLGRKCA